MEPIFLLFQMLGGETITTTHRDSPRNLWQEYCFGKSIFCSSITAGSLDGGGLKHEGIENPEAYQMKWRTLGFQQARHF